MKKRYMLLIILPFFGMGLMMPVQSLFLMEHGTNLQSLGLYTAVYAATVIIMEIPSGIFADTYGRKRSFIFSCLFGIIGCFIMLPSNSLLPILIGGALMGLSAAFSSGSIDAMAIEDTLSESDSQNLPRTVSSCTICQSLGTAAGSLCGGSLPKENRYELFLFFRIVILLLSIFIASLTLKEGKHPHEEYKTSLRNHLNSIKSCIRESISLRRIFGIIFVLAVQQVTIENYWQPQLYISVQKISQPLLGALCTGAWICTMGGGWVSGHGKLSKHKCEKVSIIFALLETILTAMLSFSWNISSFILFYLLYYLFLGLIDIPEQTILNSETSDSIRASMLSMVSFTARIGGLTGSITSSFILTKINISELWRLTAVITIAAIIWVIFLKEKFSCHS